MVPDWTGSNRYDSTGTKVSSNDYLHQIIMFGPDMSQLNKQYVVSMMNYVAAAKWVEEEEKLTKSEEEKKKNLKVQ